ncbi:Crp/Fnr family transcriptional regulator [Paenibacillus sp. 598K]|uniref:Crp/Fnr family transcriptional regulator n=1 Tax=Paenibacillus sp. 598K TaxID=1117987 RepID=UPI000FFA1D0F|nr:Crp/Fnr family transcriptional regulator [Paenibacillus sp. 598K]GBF72285.1 Crp/Fnr family transcriptional regulator [Paenibacillus sp. 598K]
MEAWMRLLEQSALFRGFDRGEMSSALLCLEGTVQKYHKKEALFHEGDALPAVGIVLSGTVFLCSVDAEGSQTILSELTSGDIVGETALQLQGDGSTHSAYAAETSDILFIQLANIIRSHGNVCALRARVIENLLALIVANNRGLYRKLDLVAQKSLRQRIVHYLELEARRKGSRTFAIPFSRADLADYLLADRSALSRELCRMADEGLIRFQRNRFELLTPIGAESGF